MSTTKLFQQHRALAEVAVRAQDLHARKNEEYDGSFYTLGLLNAKCDLRRKFARLEKVMDRDDPDRYTHEEKMVIEEQLLDLSNYALMTLTKIMKEPEC